jgi:RNA polymerase sigma factor for flagellar operon FliA
VSNVRPFLDREQLARLTEERKLPRARAESISFKCRVRELVDDLEGAGDEGLFWAAKRYTANEGTPFQPFAQVVVDRSIFSFLRRELRHRRLEAAGYVVASWGASQVFARSDDRLRALEDGEQEARAKLERFVDLKVLAGVAALCAEAEHRQRAAGQATALAELFADLRAEVALLTREEQRIFVGVYWEEKTIEEAGAEVGLPPTTAQRRLRGILGRLRAALRARGYDGTED